jgi:hypothetical protein
MSISEMVRVGKKGTDKLPPAEASIEDIRNKAAALQELEKKLPAADEEQKQKQ